MNERNNDAFLLKLESVEDHSFLAPMYVLLYVGEDLVEDWGPSFAFGFFIFPSVLVLVRRVIMADPRVTAPRFYHHLYSRDWSHWTLTTSHDVCKYVCTMYVLRMWRRMAVVRDSETQRLRALHVLCVLRTYYKV